MSEAGVRGIDLFKIAGESISGWIPSWKTGEARPTRQPFCSQMEERLLLYLQYHPQVAWYGRGEISPTFASTYKIATPLPTPFAIPYLFEGKTHSYLPDAIGQLLDGRLLIAEAGLEQDKRAGRSLLDWDGSDLVRASSCESGLFTCPASDFSRLVGPFRGVADHLAMG